MEVEGRRTASHQLALVVRLSKNFGFGAKTFKIFCLGRCHIQSSV